MTRACVTQRSISIGIEIPVSPEPLLEVTPLRAQTMFVPTIFTMLVLLAGGTARAADVEVQLGANDGFVIKNNDGTIERLRVDEATGNISRNGALFVHTTGTNNTFVGEGAGNLSTTGGRNSALGSAALNSNTSGIANAAFGEDALTANTTGSTNSAFGENSLQFNTAGNDNSAFGQDALRGNTTASFNSGFGRGALRANTTGSENSAFGANAMRENITGVRNAAFGRAALQLNTVGSDNSAFGRGALTNLDSAVVAAASGSSAFGSHALYNHEGNPASAFGTDALRSSVLGTRNSAFGFQALRNTNAAGNSGFGHHALYDNSTGTRNSAFGDSALSNNSTGTNNSAFGENALMSNTTGGYNSAFGQESLQYITTGSDNVAIGRRAGRNLTGGDSYNIHIGHPGVVGDNGVIRIGNPATPNNGVYIDGLHPWLIPGPGYSVLVNSAGLLGTSTFSSIRYKENVRDMGEVSDGLLNVRPVAFEYRKDLKGAGEGTDYGLIAEEVAKTAPVLAIVDDEGKPASVRYNLLPMMMLNELQKLERRVAELEADLERTGEASE
jgi:hypothetical protein